jgi:hypothetical protein
MGFFNEIKKGFKSVTRGAIDPFGISSDVYHAATGAPTAEQKREMAKGMNEQVKAYKEATELGRQQVAELKSQKEMERKRIEEKQIRGLRKNARAAGFLNTQSEGTQLGSSSGLPQQLGTT